MTNGDFPFNQRQMHGRVSRCPTCDVRFDSVTPLSYVERKTGNFAPHLAMGLPLSSTRLCCGTGLLSKRL